MTYHIPLSKGKLLFKCEEAGHTAVQTSVVLFCISNNHRYLRGAKVSANSNNIMCLIAINEGRYEVTGDSGSIGGPGERECELSSRNDDLSVRENAWEK